VTEEWDQTLRRPSFDIWW